MFFPGAATLQVDLNALSANYRLLRARHAKGACAAVVKADAYGLGVEAVSRTLAKAGCNFFFVATLQEAVELRRILPAIQIGVFNGLLQGEEQSYQDYQLTPIFNSLQQVERAAGMTGILHIDTGMTRLGLSESEFRQFFSKARRPNISMLMSHLACANEPENPKNAQQLQRLRAAHALLPGVPVSFTNSSGLFLSPDFHFDLGRPGCALYGINPVAGKNPMQHVATLSAPILQIRTLDRDEAVGYGGLYHAKKSSRIAIARLGYADGYFRSLSNKGYACIAGERVPIAGRISMDMIALDVSQLPEQKITHETRAEFINATFDVNALAQEADTIGYEIFTRIGKRVQRLYV